ncbi:MAG: iron-containing alcohol dehydrogenase [Chlorobiaceae bacterium]|nr:iron-containing alcohol dehydrogenase [Chlorobiaceae bacterium]NTV16496.1 iron-containing alcohol dehydrogenase [Chlorobiaceae bacterium]
MLNPNFYLFPLPAIHFGPGRFSLLAELAGTFGKNILVITGRHALEQSGRLRSLLDALRDARLNSFHFVVDREPSPELVDGAVSEYRTLSIDAVLSVGGGSVLDAGKAISAMLLYDLSVERFIEGREDFIPHNGRKVPFIAVPTTSGTGSEVTNNAVISRVGRNGFKRSLRHASFVPDIALIDPELIVTVSPELTAASGMDACTQLLEAYTSPFATPYTDALVFSGLEHFSRSFLSACTDRADDSNVRGDIAYAALMSGIALANAGLGIVHGFASSVGGLIDIPHGTLCATLLAEATRENIAQLRIIDEKHPVLQKYAKVGCMLSGSVAEDLFSDCNRLQATLDEWQELLGFPGLSSYGLLAADLDGIVKITRSKSNAVQLDHSAMKRILSNRL